MTRSRLLHPQLRRRQALLQLSIIFFVLAVVASYSPHSLESGRVKQRGAGRWRRHRCGTNDIVDSDNDHQIQTKEPKNKTEKRDNHRRTVISSLASSSFVATAAACWSGRPPTADAAVSPLFQSSSYRNGLQQLPSYVYQKKDNVGLSADPDELLPTLQDTVAVLKALAQSDAVTEGRFELVSQQLRGGLVSESKLRLGGYALLDMLPESTESDANTEAEGGSNGTPDRANDTNKRAASLSYIARERFRLFLIQFSVLDATVEAAARRQKADGGMAETVGLVLLMPFTGVDRAVRMSRQDALLGAPNVGDDERFAVLAALAETAKALEAFTAAAENALDNGNGNDNK